MDLNSRQYVVSLDMTRTGSIRESFEMRHNDDNELIIELRDSAGIIDLNASGVINATLLVTRKDKVDIPLAGTITPEGRASFKLKRASLEKQGMVEVVAQFYFANDVRISTPTLIFNVLRDPSAGAVGDEGDDRTLIEIILNDAPALLEQLQTAYDELVIQKAAFADFQVESETAFSNAQNQRTTDFNADQAARNTAFEDAQTQRTTDFNTSQGERATLFNQSQTNRQNDYQTWKEVKDNELNQLASDTENSKLAADGATTNANNAATEAFEAAEEATGAVAEVTGAKQSAVKNKTFASLDSRMEELESDTYKPMQNLVTNGNFANGTTGWTGVKTASVTASNNEIAFVGNGSWAEIYSNTISYALGDKVYVVAEVKADNNLTNISVSNRNGSLVFHSGNNQFEKLSVIYNADVTSAAHRFYVSDRRTSGWTEVKVRKVVVINLTAHFGVGKEPSKDEVDRLLNVQYDGWFDGTTNVARKLLERSAQQLVDTFVPMKNEVVNGKSVQTTSYSNYVSSLGKFSFVKGNQYYTRRKYTKQSGTESAGVSGSIRSLIPSPTIILIGDAVSRPDSQIITINEESRETELYLYGTQDGGTTLFEDIVIINLTKTFGKGNEPTKEEMDRLLAKYPNSFFDGTVNLTPKLLDDLRYLTSDVQMPMTNEIVNGDFSQGITGWISQGSTISATSNTANVIGSGSVPGPGIYKNIGKHGSSDKLYTRFKARVTNAECLYISFYSGTVSNLITFVNNPVQNIWYERSAITSYTSYDNFIAYHYYASAGDSLDKVMEIQNVLVLNLTKLFGAGNEPTQAQMDALLATYPNSWFDGTVNLAENKRMIPFLLKRLELKADKAQEAWITPTLQNGWVEEVGYPVGFYKDSMGNVKARGRIKSGSLAATIFTLPAGYRPSQAMNYAAVCGGGTFGFLQVTAAGQVQLLTGSNTYLNLDTIDFRV